MTEADYREARYVFARHMPGFSALEFDGMETHEIDGYMRLLIRELEKQRQAMDSPKR